MALLCQFCSNRGCQPPPACQLPGCPSLAPEPPLQITFPAVSFPQIWYTKILCLSVHVLLSLLFHSAHITHKGLLLVHMSFSCFHYSQCCYLQLVRIAQSRAGCTASMNLLHLWFNGAFREATQHPYLYMPGLAPYRFPCPLHPSIGTCLSMRRTIWVISADDRMKKKGADRDLSTR